MWGLEQRDGLYCWRHFTTFLEFLFRMSKKAGLVSSNRLFNVLNMSKMLAGGTNWEARKEDAIMDILKVKFPSLHDNLTILFQVFWISNILDSFMHLEHNLSFTTYSTAISIWIVWIHIDITQASFGASLWNLCVLRYLLWVPMFFKMLKKQANTYVRLQNFSLKTSCNHATTGKIVMS